MNAKKIFALFNYDFDAIIEKLNLFKEQTKSK